MPGIPVHQEDDYEISLKKFKKQCERSGILAEIRRREYFEKPSIKREKKAIAARKRMARRFRRRF